MPPAVVPPVTGVPAAPGPPSSTPTTGATLAPHAAAGITLAGSASLVLLVLLARKLGGSCCHSGTSRPHETPASRTTNVPTHALLSHSRSPTAESECSRDCATCAFRIARWEAIRHAARAARVDVDLYYAAGRIANDESESESGESEETELTVPTPDWGSETGEWTSTPELDESFKFYADMFAEYAGAGSSEEFALAFDEGCKRESRAS